MNYKYYFLLYILIISLISVIVTVSDKRRARRNKWRVRESTLLILSALGGSAAMFITMRLIRHKTQKKKFMLGIPLIFLIQVAAIVLVKAYVLR